MIRRLILALAVILLASPSGGVDEQLPPVDPTSDASLLDEAVLDGASAAERAEAELAAELDASTLPWDPDAEPAPEVVHPEIRLGPTQSRFVLSDADVVLLTSSRGEGKTTAGVFRLIRVAQEHPQAWPLRVACVRDTWVNLRRSLIVTLDEGARNGWWDLQWSEGKTEGLLNGGQVKLFLFGMDNDSDANKFQGFESGVTWLEEPAPAADIRSGIPVSVFALALTSGRQRGVRTSIQITMNPPDVGHWTLDVTEQLQELGHPEMRCAVFRIPPGENTALDPSYRVKMRLGLQLSGREDLLRRLVEGNVGTVQVGVSVTPEFSDLHIAPGPIQIRRMWPLVAGLDFGLSPAWVLAQPTPSGHLHVLATLVGVSMGIEELILQHILPWLREYGLWMDGAAQDRWGGRRRVVIRTIGDPAGYARDQSSSERSAKRTVETLLQTTLEKGPVEWSARRDAVKAVLTRMIGGRPMVQIDPDCAPLIHALRGAWHYQKHPSGKVSAQPLKDEASHISDAFGYLCAKLYPVHEWTRKLLEERPRALPPARPGSWLGV